MSAIQNWGAALWTSLTNALGLVFAFVPKLLGFLVILLIGWIVAALLGKGVTYLLRRVGFDRFSERIGLTQLEQRMNVRLDPAHLMGRIVFWFVFLIFLLPAVDALGLTAISALLGQIIGYIPNVFAALLVLFLGAILANFAADLIRGTTTRLNAGNVNMLANLARYAILGFAALIALEQLQIAPALLNILFTAIVGALALAFGLAFGLGGRENAQRWLARRDQSLDTMASQAPPARPSERMAGTGQDVRQRGYGTGD
jgi:Conserved TM helix